MTRDYVLQPFHAPPQLQIDYVKELNPQQHAAVTAPPGPALVIAGAGSGKTRTLTYRVAFLLEQGIPPDRILLLTFTNKAAKEMMGRVADLLGHELAALWGGTFHSIGNRVLRLHADLLGYERDFTILDREDSLDLIKTCVVESGVHTTAGHFPKVEVVAEVLSLAANTHRTIPEVLTAQHHRLAVLGPQLLEVERRYQSRKRANNAMDFDDLLVLWLRLLQEQQQVCEHYQRRFQFILVDEYQDTNKLQSDLVDVLAARHHNLMVVGDDAQSIYGWRGAHFQNILKFPKRYPEAKVYKIETNYRSTPQILQVANAAIAANQEQFTKVLVAARKPSAKPALVACADAAQQASFVAQRVLELREEGEDLNHMAVLYRSHFHALELQLELVRRNIPFSITSGIRFFEQAHIKDVTSYLKLVANHRDELAFKRLVQLLPGIGARGASKLWAAFQTAAVRTSEDKRAIDAGPQRPGLAAALQACAGLVPKKTAVAWAQFCATMSQLDAPEIRENPAKLIRLVLEAGYQDYLEETYTNYRSRQEDLEQLAIFSRQFPSLGDFLAQLALLTNLEAETEQPTRAEEEQLRLSTIHQAKGLEFEVVFVIMLCEGLFPSGRSLETQEGEEEERRLMYVAITRARNELYLSYPLIRANYGGGGDLVQHPSRFLREIPTELIEEWNLRI
jgi:DNA helicase-2/ATP-dependent DNA helicase PcrA